MSLTPEKTSQNTPTKTWQVHEIVKLIAAVSQHSISSLHVGDLRIVRDGGIVRSGLATPLGHAVGIGATQVSHSAPPPAVFRDDKWLKDTKEKDAST